MIWNEIWREYLGQSPLFWGLHLAIGAVTLFWGLRHGIVLLSIRRRAAGGEPVSDQEVAKHTAHAASYLPAYEYLSSAFVLVGLLGTIYGFFTGLSQNTAKAFDTSTVSPALVTSGFGIVWALLTGLGASVMERWGSGVPRWFATVASPQQVFAEVGAGMNERLDRVVAAMAGLTASFQSAFEGGSTRFSESAHEMAQTAKELRQSVDAASGSFNKSMQQAATTCDRIDAVLARTSELPAKVSASIEKFSEEHRTKLDALSMQIAGRLDEAIRRLDEAGRVVAGRLDSNAQKFDEMLKGTLVEVSAKVGSTLTTFLDRDRDAWTDFSKGLMEELRATTRAVAGELERTKELPAALSIEMKSAHQTYQETVEKVGRGILNELQAASAAVAAGLEKTKELPASLAIEMRSAHQAYQETIAAVAERMERLGSSSQAALGEIAMRDREAWAAVGKRLYDELHVATQRVATELDRTKELPAALAIEMRTAHQAYQGSLEGVAERLKGIASETQVATREALEDFARTVHQPVDEQLKQVTLLMKRLGEWIAEVKALPSEISRSITDGKGVELTHLTETTARIWHDSVRTLEAARAQRENEAVDNEMQGFRRRIPELAAAIREAAQETKTSSEEFRSHARNFSEEVKKLRVQIERLAWHTNAPTAPPVDTQLLTTLKNIEASIPAIAETATRPAPAPAATGGGWFPQVPSATPETAGPRPIVPPAREPMRFTPPKRSLWSKLFGR